MTKYNQPTSQTSRTINLAGGEAFVESPKLEFVSILLTSFLKDQFYRSEDETADRIVDLMSKISDKKFLAKAAVFARTKYGMRSVSHLVAGEIAKTVKGETWTKNFFDLVIHRPDDMTEILAYYLGKYQKPIPNSLKKGLALALPKFSEYQLAKYRGEKATVSLVDVVNLVHPQGNEAVTKLVKGTLRSTDTWESKLTVAGQKAKDEDEKEELKKGAWIDLIKEKKIGYFALLRNLRNILEQAPEVLSEALELLVDEKLIKKSLVLPFRFATAISQIEELSASGVRDTLQALNRAVEISLANVPEFSGRTLVALDGSGSMRGQPIQIGSLFAGTLYKTNDSDLLLFSEDANYINLNPNDSLLTIAQRLCQEAQYSGTNFHAIFEATNQVYDRIIILSDMQGWIGGDAPTKTFADYKRRVGANPIIYSFDLQGYGTLQFPERNVYCLAGFSEKVFDIFKLLETDRNTLISEIEKIEL